MCVCVYVTELTDGGEEGEEGEEEEVAGGVEGLAEHVGVGGFACFLRCVCVCVCVFMSVK
jgi:hypothetical protein